MKPILDEIMKQWDGTMIPFEQIPGMENRVYMFMVKGRVRSFVVVFEYVDEEWNKTPDIMMRNDDMRKVKFMEGFFAAPTTIAIDFKDRMVYVRMKDLTADFMKYVDPQGFFLPKELTTLLRKKEKAA